MGVTSDPSDPGINKPTESGPNESYLVLSDKERAKGWVRPYRESYVHVGPDGTESELKGSGCGAETFMKREISETYARDPHYYGSTYCVGCRSHFAVTEFIWSADGDRVGS